MRHFRRFFGSVAIALFLSTWAVTAPPTRAAADEGRPAKALGTFFELGLPDTRGAKWVRAYARGIQSEAALPRPINGRYSGNAWLVREESDGTVELVFEQARRIRGRRVEAAAQRGPGETDSVGLPQMQIQPANLEADLALLAATFGASHGDLHFEEGDHRAARALQSAGGSVLFLAHLQRQGRNDSVGKLLPDLLARFPSPALAIDAAISRLADARAAQLAEEWSARGDAQAYARGLEKLCAEFTRGWDKRDAAQMLMERLRKPAAAPDADEPAAARAASLLLALKAEQLDTLPRGTNWLLPAPDATDAEPDADAEVDDESDPDDAPEPPTESAATARSGPVAAFLASDRREAATALAQLLEDRRLLRVLHNVSRSFYGSSDRYATPDEKLQQAYSQLPRPYELGELTAALLEPLLPDGVRQISDNSAARNTAIRAWLKEAVSLTDEELAWDYLRNSDGASDNEFQLALSYLIAKGGDETVGKLREVFLDPAVWESGSVDPMLPMLERYTQRLGADAAAFGEKLLVVLRAESAVQQAEQLAQERGLTDDMKNAIALESAGELKKIEQVLKPRGLSELLAELHDASDEDANAMIEALAPTLNKAAPAEAEAHVLQAAAKLKSVATKHRLLVVLAQRQTPKRAATPPPPETQKVALEAATRSALEALLNDEAAVFQEWNHSESTIADVAATTFLWWRLSPNEQTARMAMWQKAPHLGSRLLRADARALAAGQPLPPMPDPAQVPAARVQALLDELASQPPEQIIPALHTKAPDEQLAVIARLTQQAEWPAAFVAAHLTIFAVKGEAVSALKAERWKGRRFDASLRSEIEQAIEDAARASRPFVVTLHAAAALSGLTLLAQPSKETMDANQLTDSVRGLSGKPAPVAVLARWIQKASDPDGNSAIGYFTPLGPDAAQTSAWYEEQLKAEAAKPEQPASDDDETNRVRSLEKPLADIYAGKPETRVGFQIIWMVSLVEKAEEEDADDEP